ncbi:uncharacterized protein LOC120023940 [Salvelinus namaycush]|uniref:Uncharacterized protein LOC120023940 n=1 Tax=Salvelinus namaycush TaxID=8040 RepID=A0A8U0TPX6_SALNM|nr:uncharacterized protein LOC120023940 [Salvelinus namaycush]
MTVATMMGSAIKSMLHCIAVLEAFYRSVRSQRCSTDPYDPRGVLQIRTIPEAFYRSIRSQRRSTDPYDPRGVLQIRTIPEVFYRSVRSQRFLQIRTIPEVFYRSVRSQRFLQIRTIPEVFYRSSNYYAVLHGLTLSYILGINVNKLSQYVNVGVDVHLPCHNTVDPEDCSSTIWLYSRAGIENAITAVSKTKSPHPHQRQIYSVTLQRKDNNRKWRCHLTDKGKVKTSIDYIVFLHSQWLAKVFTPCNVRRLRMKMRNHRTKSQRVLNQSEVIWVAVVLMAVCVAAALIVIFRWRIIFQEIRC